MATLPFLVSQIYKDTRKSINEKKRIREGRKDILDLFLKMLDNTDLFLHPVA